MAFALAFAAVPLFPSFITLTAVAFPGVSVVPLPMALVVLGLMVLLALWAIVVVLMPPRAPVPLARPIGAWLLACLLSVALGFNPRDGLIFVGILGLAAIWHVALMREYDDGAVARASWWSFVVSGTIACVVALGMIVTRVPASQYTIAHGRAVGTFVLPGELAGFLIFFLPITFALARVAKSRVLRTLCWCAFGIGALTMLATFSRTGWVGLASAAGFWIAANERGRKRGLIAAGAVLAAALVLVLALFNEHHNPSENYTRITIWQAALGVIDRFPLTGVGPFGFSHIYPFVRLPDGDETAFHAHSMYLTFLAELGVVGFSAFVWTVVAAGRELVRRLRGAKPEAALLALAVAAGLVGTLVQGLIDTVSVVIFGLFLPMLALALLTARSGTGDA
ncbi:MAG TPA: O-antigen ligase family protein [Candidatus Baltobacteraceae bacterium]|nr:O-antigen ligase family protein [Candidatus Baltobacteraceae bacterium]